MEEGALTIAIFNVGRTPLALYAVHKAGLPAQCETLVKGICRVAK